MTVAHQQELLYASLLPQKIVQQEEPFLPGSTTATVLPTTTGLPSLALESGAALATATGCVVAAVFASAVGVFAGALAALGGAEAGAADY